MADRIVVLHGGAVAGVVRPEETDRFEVGRLMLGPEDHAGAADHAGQADDVQGPEGGTEA
jgi:ABC-type uncharacterized transport system ATPase subunit